MRQLKRIGAVALTLLLTAAVGSVPSMAQEAVTEALTETVSEAAADDSGEAIVNLMSGSADIDQDQIFDDMLALLQKIPADKLSALLAEHIPGASAEEIQEYIEMIQALLENEDFRSLMSYDEVWDLAIYAGENLAEMAVEEPELTRKVLETLEVNEMVIRITMGLIDHKEQIAQALNELDIQWQSGEAAELLEDLAGNQELRTGLEELLTILQGGTEDE